MNATRETFTDMWIGVGYGSIPVPGLHHSRVLEARGEWPILYYPAELSPAEVIHEHGWAIGDLFRQRAIWHGLALAPGETWEVLTD